MSVSRLSVISVLSRSSISLASPSHFDHRRTRLLYFCDKFSDTLFHCGSQIPALISASVCRQYHTTQWANEESILGQLQQPQQPTPNEHLPEQSALNYTFDDANGDMQNADNFESSKTIHNSPILNHFLSLYDSALAGQHAGKWEQFTMVNILISLQRMANKREKSGGKSANARQHMVLSFAQLRGNRQFEEVLNAVICSPLHHLRVPELIQVFLFVERIYMNHDCHEIRCVVNALTFAMRKTGIKSLLSLFSIFCSRQHGDLHISLMKEVISLIETRHLEIVDVDKMLILLSHTDSFSAEFNHNLNQRILESMATIEFKDKLHMLAVMSSRKVRNVPILHSIAHSILTSGKKIEPSTAVDCINSFSHLHMRISAVLCMLCEAVDSQYIANMSESNFATFLRSMGYLGLRHHATLDAIVNNRLALQLQQHASRSDAPDVKKLTLEVTTTIVTLAMLNYVPKNSDSLFQYARQNLTGPASITSIFNKSANQSGTAKSSLSQPNPLPANAISSRWINIVWSLVILGEQSSQQVASVLNNEFLRGWLGPTLDSIDVETAADTPSPSLNSVYQLMNINASRMREHQQIGTINEVSTNNQTHNDSSANSISEVGQLLRRSETHLTDCLASKRKLMSGGVLHSSSHNFVVDTMLSALDTLVSTPDYALHRVSALDEQQIPLGFTVDAICCYSTNDLCPKAVPCMFDSSEDTSLVKLAIVVRSYKETCLVDQMRATPSALKSSVSTNWSAAVRGKSSAPTGSAAIKVQLLKRNGFTPVVVRHDEIDMADMTQNIRMLDSKIKTTVEEIKKTSESKPLLDV